MKFKKVSVLLILLVAILAFSGCQATDIVAKVSVTSFDSLVTAIPDKVTFDNAKKVWVISGLDGKEEIILSEDFSSSNADIVLELNAEPFIKAGLDVTKLPMNQYHYDEATGKITLPFEYGGDKFKAGAEKSALDTFKQIVKTHRNIIGYHEEGDHYKITLGNGNSFAWAKDLSTNKTDIAFILNPQPFIEAGVDTGKIKEWAFAKMPVTDKSGKPVKVDVFIKGFNVQTTQYAQVEGDVQKVSIDIQSDKYAPIVVQKGIPVQFTIKANSSDLKSCISTITIPKYNIEKELHSGENIIEFIPKENGVIPYSCKMGMIKSKIRIVDDVAKSKASDLGK